MIYNQRPPYEVLKTKLLDFATMQKVRRFARYWDLIGNSGNFVETTRQIWSAQPSPFHAFMRWSEWLHARAGRTDSIALIRLMEFLFNFLTTELKLDAREIAEVMWRDYQRGGRRDKPDFLRLLLPQNIQPTRREQQRAGIPKRQRRQQKWEAAQAQ
jgi:hypothetical protein